MKKLLIGLLALGSFSAFSQVSDQELECLKDYKETSYKCTYKEKSYPSVISGQGEHVSKRVAKNLAKENCESASGKECRYSMCSESFGLYSKMHVSGGSQTVTIGGNPDYRKQRRQDKRELKRLRREAMQVCSGL
jgi:hypothetical protein